MQKLYRTILFVPLFLLSACAMLDSEGCPKNVKFTTLQAKNDNPDGKGQGGGFTRIRINPDTVEVELGCFFEIKNPRGVTFNTTSAISWLEGGPTNGNLVLGPAVCTVGGCQGGDPAFKYTIKVDDVGQLDPRVRVR